MGHAGHVRLQFPTGRPLQRLDSIRALCQSITREPPLGRKSSVEADFFGCALQLYHPALCGPSQTPTRVVSKLGHYANAKPIDFTETVKRKNAAGRLTPTAFAVFPEGPLSLHVRLALFSMPWHTARSASGAGAGSNSRKLQSQSCPERRLCHRFHQPDGSVNSVRSWPQCGFG